jgi:hypothetical protein
MPTRPLFAVSGKAAAHSAAFFHGWQQAGVDRADLAIRRPDGVMLWQSDRPLAQLALPWARAHNVRQADIYIRPARGYAWPLVFLDDVALGMAGRIARKYASVVVHTSAAGGCHLWLRVTKSLDERQRYHVQRWLVPRVGADPGSVSGEHLGRLPGMKNWKRHGGWVNLLDGGNPVAPRWNPAPALMSLPPDDKPLVNKPAGLQGAGTDGSESGREWGWVCGALEAGVPTEIVYQQLVQRASPRRGRDAERYARHTIEHARHHLA